MALIKEDGTIVTDANSYADAADSIAYQTDRGRQSWLDATTEVQEAALIRATDYIETRFGRRFVGVPLGDVQELAWPRQGAVYPRTGNAFPTDEVPEDVLNAAILYAGEIIGPDGDDLELMTELAITPDIDSSNVKKKTEKVDVLAESTEYFGGGSTLRTIQPYPEADRLLRPWLRGGGLGGLTARAA